MWLNVLAGFGFAPHVWPPGESQQVQVGMQTDDGG